MRISRLVDRIGLLSCFAFLTVLGVSDSASAYFRICNNSGLPITYAEAYADSATCSWGANGGTGCGGYRKHGWHNIPNGQCQIVYNGSALNRTFYWYARSYDGTVHWTSNNNRFQHPSVGHGECFDLHQPTLWRCYRGTYYFDAAMPYYNHRSHFTNATDYTLTIVR